MSERTYTAWLYDAHSTHDRALELANELRERWRDWKAVSEYTTWRECLRAELGISDGALRERNSYRRRRARRAEPQQEKAGDVEPAQSGNVRMPDGPESDQEPRSTARRRTPRRLTPEEVEEYTTGPERPRQESRRDLTRARLERDASNAIKEGATAGEATLSAVRAMTVEQQADCYASVVVTAAYWWEAMNLCEAATEVCG